MSRAKDKARKLRRREKREAVHQISLVMAQAHNRSELFDLVDGAGGDLLAAADAVAEWFSGRWRDEWNPVLRSGETAQEHCQRHLGPVIVLTIEQVRRKELPAQTMTIGAGPLKDVFHDLAKAMAMEEGREVGELSGVEVLEGDL